MLGPLLDKVLVKIEGVLRLLGPRCCDHWNQEVEKPLGTYSKPLRSPWNPFYNLFWFSKSKWAPRNLEGGTHFCSSPQCDDATLNRYVQRRDAHNKNIKKIKKEPT